MHFGLVISVLLHAAILGWTMLSFQSQRELRLPETQAVAVGMVTPSELTKVRLGSPTAKQPEAEAKESPKGEPAKKEAAKPRPVAAAPPPTPPPDPPAPKAEQKLDPIAQKLAEATPPPPPPKATPPPAASPPSAAAPDEQKDADAAKAKREAEEQRLAEEKRKAEDQKRTEEKKRAEEQKRLEEQRRQAELKKKREEEKKRKEAALKKKREEEKKRQEAEMAAKSKFDADRIAALLNKVPDAGAPPPSAPLTEPTKAKGPTLGAPEGRDKQLSASEIAMLKARISSQIKQKECWRLPAGGGGSDLPVVTVRWRLKPDGSLDGDPQVDQPRGDALFRVAAETALRAVRACAPFDLPPDMYKTWRLIIWDFDPSAML